MVQVEDARYAWFMQERSRHTPMSDGELNDLREAIIEHLVDDPNDLTVADVDAWLTGEEEEQYQIMTDDEIVAEVLDCSDENTHTRARAHTHTHTHTRTHTHTTNNDRALIIFTTAITWAEENGGSATAILTLKRLQESVKNIPFVQKSKNSLKTLFFCHE
ncbi:hypothetical protein J6590_066673 [Homalodisca vitripennis]|nr:hypothetical protein J6590_066673 [Homalodisca vitripennis]